MNFKLREFWYWRRIICTNFIFKTSEHVEVTLNSLLKCIFIRAGHSWLCRKAPFIIHLFSFLPGLGRNVLGLCPRRNVKDLKGM